MKLIGVPDKYTVLKLVDGKCTSTYHCLVVDPCHPCLV